LMIALLLSSSRDVHPWTISKLITCRCTTTHNRYIHRNRHGPRRFQLCASLKSKESEINNTSIRSRIILDEKEEESILIGLTKEATMLMTTTTIVDYVGAATTTPTTNSNTFWTFFQLSCFSLILSLLLISWEDISMSHPMRKESSTLLVSSSSSSASSLNLWGRSTIRGMAFGRQERRAITAVADLESNMVRDLPSYNEVMLRHRTNRIPLWNNIATTIVSRKDVNDSVLTVQVALLRILDCEDLARNYEWDQLITTLNEKTLRSDLDKACYVLKGADQFLSREARDEIGFDWGSCALRHCGALSDAQEAIDELNTRVGMLEPYECLFVLDVVERSLRDILAVTIEYHHDTITTASKKTIPSSSMKMPKYTTLQRMSDLPNEDLLDRAETDYLKTLSFFRNSEF